ncbi:redox-sensitive transcriptional activator SoxR [Marmoricola sp. RAF53]|uniref:redox-sensitive transcriptional activator SoxR n=1 Tax=Marmoricola sp. RAF53 TaxID=3233059 RepID=UPI003F99F995
MDTHDVLTVSEVARRSGFAASALRYYEDQGLIHARRSSGGQRRYERGVLRRLAFIRAAGNIGLTLGEIRAELDTLPRSRTPTKADWQRISRHWRTRLDDRISALERLRDGLDSCIGCGCLSLQRCAISNPGDVAAGSGEAPGAAYLPAGLRRVQPGERGPGRSGR